MGTSKDHRNLMKTGLGILLLVALLQTGTEAAICSVFPPLQRVKENQPVGTVVTTIEVEDASVVLDDMNPNDPFTLDGLNLVTTEILDYELGTRRYEVTIACSKPGVPAINLVFNVVVDNLNDNIPKFGQPLYNVDVDEMKPVGSSVGTFDATDADNMGQLFYTLTPQDSFSLKPNTAEIVVAKLLQYDDVKTVELTLTVQDEDPTHTASTTIRITIKDVDNRPPWFQPCTQVEVQGVKICPNSGYRGNVNLGQLVTGSLDLIPNQISAIDGDNGIEEDIQYAIISGDEGLFTIDPGTGNITQVSAVNEVKTVHMTVMAFQAVNTYQFATTTLAIDVLIKSLHPPEFAQAQYTAIVEGVGKMAVEAADKSEALKLMVTDKDYDDVGGINPNVVFTTDNPDFSVIDGFLFMTTDVAAGKYNIQVKAVDTKDFQQATAQIAVEVLKEPTTTAPPTTTSSQTLEPTTGKTTAPTSGSTDITTNQTPDQTTKPDSTTPGTSPSTSDTAAPSSNPTTLGTTGASVQTSNPTPTNGGTTGSTAHTAGEIDPPGGFTSVDMAALGATLGVLLFICVVVIAVLIVKVRKGNSDWKKINEASAFRSSLGPSGQKVGVQFTNEAFQHDDDDKDNKGGPSGGDLKKDTDKPQTRSIPRPPSPIPDDEKEVKPILSKDKSKEDGYKAVWFKEDIDPNAKEEVVIIPDSRAEEEEDSDGEMKTPKVKFNDTDGDSGLGEKMDDSEEERVMMSSL